MLYDQAVLGCFDGENYQLGFVDICHKPYAEIASYTGAAHQAVYGVASGKGEAYPVKSRTMEFIAF
jgi:hypothetical protein